MIIHQKINFREKILNNIIEIKFIILINFKINKIILCIVNKKIILTIKEIFPIID